MAARSDVTISVDTTVLDRILRDAPDEFLRQIMKTAFDVERRAKLWATPFVDTGAHRASIYTETPEGAFVEGSKTATTAVMAAAKGRNRDVETVALPRPARDEMVCYVGPSVEYGIHLELGTSYRAATPYLSPAVREAESQLRDRMAQAIEDAAQ